jgi:16S rRNA (guanine(966)-N(2))-methyltransferase RsmD
MSLEPLAGLSVIDLFAGSGTLGIEALSRGASRVDFVEASRPAREALAANLEILELAERSTVWPLRLPAGLARLDAAMSQADLVLLDPPYGGDLANETLAALGARVKAGARVVVEHHAKDEMPERAGALVRIRERRYGETMVTTYRSVAAEENG